MSARKALSADPPAPTQSRIPSPSTSTTSSKPGSVRVASMNPPHLVPKGSGDVAKARKPMTVYDEAVQRVQEWNEALNGRYVLLTPLIHVASPKNLGTVRRLPTALQPRRSSANRKPEPQAPLSLFALPALPSRASTDSIAAEPSSSAHPSPAHPSHQAPGGLLQKNMHVSDVLHRAKEVAGESWDDDFAADISLSRLREFGS